jgi:pilus assembly protein CpaB
VARLRGIGRVITIVLAVVLAGVAAFAIWSYVQGIEQRAFEGVELVEVFVAQEEIPAGLSAAAAGEAGLIVRDAVPRDMVPPGAIASLDQIAGLVALERILEGEVITRQRWADPAAIVATLDIPDGFEALSVQVEIPPGVAGFVRPGDQVSLIATLERTGEVTVDPVTGAETTEEPEVFTQYLIQGIEVLSVGQRVTTQEGEDGVEVSTSQVLLTVALAPVDAERMVAAIQSASLYFTLLPEDAEPADTPGRTLDDLFD